METTCQASYPLNSENASPPGTVRVYLSCCANAKLPKIASTTATAPPIAAGLARTLCRVGNECASDMIILLGWVALKCTWQDEDDLDAPSRPLPVRACALILSYCRAAAVALTHGQPNGRSQPPKKSGI